MNGDNNESIERFAVLCAKLDDGDPSRALVLASAGMDERALDDLCRRWLPLLASGRDADLAICFASSYARARVRAARDEDGAPSEVDGADTERDATGCIPVIADMDRTAEVVLVHAASVLPFKRGVANAGDLVLQPCDALPLLSPCVGTGDPTETTLEVPGASPTALALPFAQPAATGRRQRLQRFDTQTGQPLAVPVWVDEPEPPSPQP